MDVTHMTFEVFDNFEVIVADVACRVTLQVSVCFCNGFKFLLTDFALHVSFEVYFLHKAFPTLLTLEGPFSCMGSFMIF